MGVQFERVTQTSAQSLTLIVGDIAATWRQDRRPREADSQDLDDWLNALHRQSIPLISSRAGRENLAAWLEAVDGLLDSEDGALHS